MKTINNYSFDWDIPEGQMINSMIFCRGVRRNKDGEIVNTIDMDAVLYEYNHEVLIFVTWCGIFELMYFHIYDTSNLVSRYICTPSNAETISRLRAGDIDIRSMFTKDWQGVDEDCNKKIYVLDINIRKEIVNSYAVALKDVPESAIPIAGVTLY